MRFRLLPTDDSFFDLFDAAAENAVTCAEALQALLLGTATGIEAVATSEREGDRLTREILQRLDRSFVTPFDREDIHALAEELDDVVDDMLAVAARVDIVRRGPLLPELEQQAELLVTMAKEMVGIVSLLVSMKGVSPGLEAIDRLESEGDRLYRQALARLFSGEYEALDVLRWKDIVEAMELVLNTIEDVSNVVESIVLKHA